MVICVNPSANFRIIVPALEIIQASFGIIEVASIPQRVYICEVAGGGEQLAPCVVGVRGSFGAGCGYDLENVALKVLDVEVFCVSAVRGSGEAYHIAGRIVVEIQRVGISNIRRQLAALPDVVVSYTVDGFVRAQAGLFVDKADRVVALGHGGQLSAALPAHCPAAVAQGVAYAVVCYLLAIVRG